MKDIITGLIRHALTAAGGGLVAHGLVSTGQVETISGAILAIIGVVWSVIVKKVSEKNTTAGSVLNELSK